MPYMEGHHKCPLKQQQHAVAGIEKLRIRIAGAHGGGLQVRLWLPSDSHISGPLIADRIHISISCVRCLQKVI